MQAMANHTTDAPSLCLAKTVRFFFPETFIMFSNNSTFDARLSFEMSPLEQVVRCMQVFIVPILSSLGILGSLFCCVVFLKTRLRKKFYSHFLVCVSASSGGFLSTVMTTWLNGQGVDVYNAPGLCQIVVFSSHFFPLLTFWSTLIGAYLILWDSLKPRSLAWMNSSSTAKCIIVAMAICGFTMYSYKTWTNGTVSVQGYRICSVLPENEAAMAVLNVLDILFLLIVPSVFFFVFDMLFLITKMSGRCKIHKSQCSKRHREVMKLVLAHSICFHILVTPRGVSMLAFIANRWIYGVFPTFNEILTQQVFQFLFYAYFAVLPYLPLLMSEKFRFYFLLLLGLRPARRRCGLYPMRRQPSFL
ncbi:uncharacterized protein LOC124137190 [Haliotis rufescens]|uniref:uncharacterized protein LOC124137190 n=1 Tax=Haliotis rufescens TaxID=6454 RepID=UPI00201ED04B|nr:uncharacterized protein LOC124137190 [Haliotis rufescens]